jgi:CBS domain-containing protein
MSTEFPTVGPSMSVAEMVHARVLINGQDYFAVVDQGKLLGIVTAREIEKLPKSRWGSTSAGQVMRLPKHLGTASAAYSAANVLEAMDRLRVDRIPVIEEDKMVGIVAREGILRLAGVRARLRV